MVDRMVLLDAAVKRHRTETADPGSVGVSTASSDVLICTLCIGHPTYGTKMQTELLARRDPYDHDRPSNVIDVWYGDQVVATISGWDGPGVIITVATEAQKLHVERHPAPINRALVVSVVY